MRSYWRRALVVMLFFTAFGTLAGFMVCRSMPVIYEATAVFAAKNPDRLSETTGIGGRLHKELVRDVTATYRADHPSFVPSGSIAGAFLGGMVAWMTCLRQRGGRAA